MANEERKAEIATNYNKLRSYGVDPDTAKKMKFWGKKKLLRVFKQLEAVNFYNKKQEVKQVIEGALNG